MNHKILLLSLLLVCLCSCDKGNLNANKYLNYFHNPENGLNLLFDTKNFEYNLQYRSPEYMALSESKGSNFTKAQLEELIREYEGMEYFLMNIKSKNYKMPEMDQQQLAFDFQKHIFLVGSDTILPQMYHFENLQSLGKGYQFLLGFDAELRSGNPIALCIDTFQNDANIQIPFDNNNFANLPKLSL
ncbi:MAG: hypothetical protein KA143_04660 [Saprospiraceae bacterium]|nr:hypothetical protein [Saprospiraceae bacterium]